MKEGEKKERDRSRIRKQMMINKENQRRKIEDSKKESRTQTKKQTEGERENLRYSEIYKGEGQKIQDSTGK